MRAKQHDSEKNIRNESKLGLKSVCLDAKICLFSVKLLVEQENKKINIDSSLIVTDVQLHHWNAFVLKLEQILKRRTFDLLVVKVPRPGDSDDLFGLRVKLPPVTTNLTTQKCRQSC